MSNVVASSVSNGIFSLGQDKHFTTVRFARALAQGDIKELARFTPTFTQRGKEVKVVVLQGRWYHSMILNILPGREITGCKDVLGAKSNELPFEPIPENQAFPLLLYKAANQK